MLAVGFALALCAQNGASRQVYTPRSYWRFENASNWTVDEQGAVLLQNWEGTTDSETIINPSETIGKGMVQIGKV